MSLVELKTAYRQLWYGCGINIKPKIAILSIKMYLEVGLLLTNCKQIYGREVFQKDIKSCAAKKLIF